MRTTSRRSRLLLPALAFVALAALAGCSSDDDKTTTDTTSGPNTTAAGGGESAATVRFDKEIQAELKEVGCYTGAVDGIIGPETDAAIVAFQQAEGLEVDGELGPETESALKKAVADGKTVCTGNSGTTATPPTTKAPDTAPCTASAIAAGLPSGATVISYVCSEGWAAGSYTNTEVDADFVLQDEGGKWVKPAQDPCGSASAGLPPIILEDGCSAS